MHELRALLTGSTPFAGLDRSAAFDAVNVLAAGPSPQGLVLIPAIVPAVHAGLGELISDLIRRHRPDLVLGLGIEPGIAAIRVEQTALNLVDSTIPDNAGQLLSRRVPYPGEPAALFGTAPAALMATRMRAAGIPAEVSDFAGTHLCNLTFYTALRQLAVTGRAVPCSYLHLALMPEQVAGIGDVVPTQGRSASMSFDLQVRAVQIALATMAEQARAEVPNSENP